MEWFIQEPPESWTLRCRRGLPTLIQKKSDMRAQARNGFEKFFKLMNNSIYGKTSENQKKRRDINLITEENQRRRLIEKAHCIGFKIFDEHLAAVKMRKETLMIMNPFYLGFSVLELSKLQMYKYANQILLNRTCLQTGIIFCLYMNL